MKHDTVEKLMSMFVGLLISILMLMFWYQANMEAEVWNRCHPTQSITPWEALWTSTRIDNCD